MGRFLPLLGLLLPGLALAGTPVELPPGEDTAAWKEALALGQQLVPGLELGLAVGPGPSVRIVPQDDGWALHIRSSLGHVEPVMLPVPDTSAARLELLLVCADALAVPAAADATPTEPASPATHPWHIGPTFLAAGYDPLPGDGRPIALLLEPTSLRRGRLGLSPMLSLGLPTSLEPDLRLSTSELSVHGRWSTEGRLRWRLGAGLGVELRDIASDDQPLLRDWSTIGSLDSDLSLALGSGWRPTLGLRLAGALPPTVLVWQDQELSLPTWSLLLVAGLQLPWPSMDL
jgi:hypothetical protein